MSVSKLILSSARSYLFMRKFGQFLIMKIIFFKNTFAPININKHACILHIKCIKLWKEKRPQACSVNVLFDLVTADCNCVTVSISYTYSNAAMQKSVLIKIRINAPVLNYTITKRLCILPNESHF